MLSLYPTANGAAEGDGLNLGSYNFSSPNPQNLNTSIVRLDWDPVSHHQLFFRGNLQDDTTEDPVQFPGQPPTYVVRDNTKGLGAGDTWEITNNLVNDFRYGYIRQGYSQAGADCGAYVEFFRTLSTPTAQTCTTIVHVPVQNFIDNVSWTHGNHAISFGGDLRLITNYSSSNLTSPMAMPTPTSNGWIQEDRLRETEAVSIPALSASLRSMTAIPPPTARWWQ